MKYMLLVYNHRRRSVAVVRLSAGFPRLDRQTTLRLHVITHVRRQLSAPARVPFV